MPSTALLQRSMASNIETFLSKKGEGLRMVMAIESSDDKSVGFLTNDTHMKKLVRLSLYITCTAGPDESEVVHVVAYRDDRERRKAWIRKR
jgi:hypothetical protein